MRPVNRRQPASVFLLAGCLLGLTAWWVLRERAPTELSSWIVSRNVRQTYSEDQVPKFKEGYKDDSNPAFLDYLRKRWIDPPRTTKVGPKADTSMVGEFAFVDQLLKKRTNGFFLECGAHDGMFQSNTIGFETQRNWTGLLIEANPGLYKKLLSKNRRVYSINACLSPYKYSSQIKFLLSGAWGGLTDLMEPGMKSLAIKNDGKAESVLQCFTLHSILLALGQTHIDYFSLDVQGPEVEIMETIPFAELDIEVIGVEYHVLHPNGTVDEHTSTMKLNKLRKLMKDTGLYKDVGLLPKERAVNIFFQKI